MTDRLSLDRRRALLGGLRRRLADAVGASELAEATDADVAGIIRSTSCDQIRVGQRLLDSAMPRIELQLDPPESAAWLSDAWGIARPVGVSGDVHQSRWHLLAGGHPIPDPHNDRIAADPPDAGLWTLDVSLSARPLGPLPATVVGASPAYDLREIDASVAAITVRRDWQPVDIVSFDHPDVAELFPRPRRMPDRDAATVVVYADSRPVAAATFHVTDSRLVASAFTFASGPGSELAGATLLDALEALAIADDATVVRLDGSVFMPGVSVPHERYGYMLPVYEGDPDADIWAERPTRW